MASAKGSVEREGSAKTEGAISVFASEGSFLGDALEAHEQKNQGPEMSSYPLRAFSVGTMILFGRTRLPSSVSLRQQYVRRWGNNIKNTYTDSPMALATALAADDLLAEDTGRAQSLSAPLLNDN